MITYRDDQKKNLTRDDPKCQSETFQFSFDDAIA